MARRSLPLAAALLVAGFPLAAQTPVEVINQLFTFGNCGKPLCLDLPVDPITNQTHGEHFIPALTTSGGTVISFLTSAIGLSVSSTPVSSASGGTTFRFEGGIPVKTSTSAGPILGERAQTLGQGRWFVGLGFTQVQYQRFRGVSLNDITFNFVHENRPPLDTVGVPPLERDFIQMNLSMQVNLLVTALTATYGLLNGVDVGVTVPFVRTSVSGHSKAVIFLVGGDTLHHFGGTGANPVLSASASSAGVATGLGDVEGHVKIALKQGQHVGIAVLGSVRFATGDAANLLGAGATSARGIGILSGRFGDFNPHAYLGYAGRGGQATNQVEANLGFDQLLAPWATLAFDLLGSWQSGASKIDVPPPVQYTAPFPYTLPVTNIPKVRDNFMNLSTGFKFRTRRGIQIVTNALIPLRDAGLQADIVGTFGLEYNF